MKTRNILQLPALILALALAAAPRSQAVVYTWNTDTSTAFDVSISGTGLWTGTLDSPNGLWELGAHAWFTDISPVELELSNGGDKMTYLGTINGISRPYENLQGYADYLPAVVPAHDG